MTKFTEIYCTADTKLNKGDVFRLIGHAREFSVCTTYLAAGFIPSVKGVSTDGRFQTIARIADVIQINRAA